MRGRTGRIRLFQASTLALVLRFAVADAAPPTPTDPARSFLATAFDVTAADLARIDAGQVVARGLRADDKREVGTVGIVRIGIPPEFYVERLADIATFKRDPAILQIGTFSSPPSSQDVANLTLDDSDIKNLRSCHVGSCGVQLSAAAIERFQRGVDWRRPDAARQANRMLQEILVDYVTSYVRAGNAAAMRYADHEDGVDLGREFASLARADDRLWLPFSRLHEHLMEYPVRESTEIRDLLYWSKEMVGRRPVVSVTHLAIADMPPESAAEFAIASKHIYGTHYFIASVGLTVLLRDRSMPSAATYVVYVNRSRIDLFDGTFGSFVRKAVSGKARSLVSQQLGRMQATLERDFAMTRANPLH
jgi:hypothetical protein